MDRCHHASLSMSNGILYAVKTSKDHNSDNDIWGTTWHLGISYFISMVTREVSSMKNNDWRKLRQGWQQCFLIWQVWLSQNVNEYPTNKHWTNWKSSLYWIRNNIETLSNRVLVSGICDFKITGKHPCLRTDLWASFKHPSSYKKSENFQGKLCHG